MERLKAMKERLVSCVQAEMMDLKSADAEELGEAVDMIKDLAQAIYYCTITKAMEEEEQKGEQRRYYHPPYDARMYDPERDIDRRDGRMYYTPNGGGNSNGGSRGGNGGRNGSGSTAYYTDDRYDDSYPMHIHDFREGKSALSRKSYIESKELHQDKNVHIKELQRYLRELSEDITEMIQGATPEEKMMLKQKIATLADKV